MIYEYEGCNFIENKYNRWYEQIINKAKLRCHGMEKHHIIPKSIGGGDEKGNIVSLTYREHFVAHHLLVKFTIKKCRTAMLRALSCMRCSRHGRGLTARQFEVSRRALSYATKDKPSPLKGVPKSPETRAKMRASWETSNRDQSYFDGLRYRAQNRSEETREKLRISATNISDETRRRRSESAKGRKLTPEDRKKISDSMIGHKRCVGRILSEETKAKIGEKSRNRSPETIAKMSELRKQWWKNKRDSIQAQT